MAEARVRAGTHANGEARGYDSPDESGRDDGQRRSHDSPDEDGRGPRPRGAARRRGGPAQQTEAARKLIGLTLLVLMIAIVVMSFAALMAIESQLHAANRAVIAAVRDHGDPQRLLALAQLASAQSKDDGDRLTGLITIIFGPVVALLGSVTGFYFGGKGGRG